MACFFTRTSDNNLTYWVFLFQAWCDGLFLRIWNVIFLLWEQPPKKSQAISLRFARILNAPPRWGFWNPFLRERLWRIWNSQDKNSMDFSKEIRLRVHHFFFTSNKYSSFANRIIIKDPCEVVSLEWARYLPFELGTFFWHSRNHFSQTKNK